MTTEEKLREIKRTFRLYMDGARMQSMREKGLNYHLNWGVSIGHLHEIAKEYGSDYDLAIQLWKENIRECKILATIIMPPEDFQSDLAFLWIEQLESQEVAEYLSMNLLQKVYYAKDLAFQLISIPAEMPRICGYSILSHLFRNGLEMDERDICEYIDQAQSVLHAKDESIGLRKAVMSSMYRFADLGDEYNNIIQHLNIT